MVKLYIIATPIGNLEDITFRAVRILKEVDLVLAENVIKARNLLNRYQIDTKIVKYEQHSLTRVLDRLISILKEGKDVALISEAGTPGISDPGNFLVSKIGILKKGIQIEEFNLENLQTEFDELMGDTCILCGQPIKKEK